MKKFPKPPVVEKPRRLVPTQEIEIESETELALIEELYASGPRARATYAKENKAGSISAIAQETKRTFNCIDCGCFAHSIRLTTFEPIEKYTLRGDKYQEISIRRCAFYTCSNEKCGWYFPFTVRKNRFRFDFSKIQGEPREYLQEIFASKENSGFQLKLWNKYHKTSKAARKKRLERLKNRPTYDPIGTLEL